MAVSLWYGFTVYFSTRSSPSRSNLVTIFYRDGTLYFILITGKTRPSIEDGLMTLVLAMTATNTAIAAYELVSFVALK